MKAFAKKYWKIILFFVLCGFIGGFFTGIFMIDSYPAELRDQLTEQGITSSILAIITALQAAGYGIVLGVIGIIISKKIGLWRDEIKLEKRPLLLTLAVALVGGIVMILADPLFFGKFEPILMDAYLIKPTVEYVIGSVIYGGVIEEVMLRLFLMSLIALVLHFLFERKREQTSALVFVLANLISAMLFAAGHLPATQMLLGLSPMIVFRCFLLNGAFGFAFGELYRKCGIHYSMLAHAGCHVVSKLIWILFL